MRIVYMGTPDFAVEGLKKLVESKHDVVAVVTVADKPVGRGHKIKFSPVKEFALKNDIPVLQPTNLKDEVFVNELESYKADLFVVVAFRMLPEVVWSMPPKGTINLHGSLLPNYRGAAPINWAVINGEKETGVTTFFIEKEIDTGKIIDQRKVAISENINVGELHDQLMVIGGQLIVDTVNEIEKGNVEGNAQSSYDLSQIKPAPKLFKENTRIDWKKDAQSIHNLIRGLSPYPVAWTNLNKEGEELAVKIFKAKVSEEGYSLAPGKFKITKRNLFVGTGNGVLEILTLQIPGKKRMETSALLNGYGLSEENFMF